MTIFGGLLAESRTRLAPESYAFRRSRLAFALARVTNGANTAA
jgi:hypothetical protein